MAESVTNKRYEYPTVRIWMVDGESCDYVWNYRGCIHNIFEDYDKVTLITDVFRTKQTIRVAHIIKVMEIGTGYIEEGEYNGR